MFVVLSIVQVELLLQPDPCLTSDLKVLPGHISQSKAIKTGEVGLVITESTAELCCVNN